MQRIAAILLSISTLLFVACGGGGDGEAKKTRFIAIGTGGVTGVYYPTGGAIAKIINRNTRRHGLKATTEATGGSVFNINAVLSGDLDFGIAQSDRQYQVYNGLAEWKGNPQPRIRSVFSLHSESVTLIASDPSDIWTPADMKGKRIAIGNPGSGHRGNALDALWASGISLDDIIPEDLKPAECAGMLQDGRIDAYFYTVGHPNGSIKEAVAGTTPVHFVPIVNIDTLLKKNPYYTYAEIDIGHYQGVSNQENVPTFGVKATLVTSSDVPEEVVYTLTREVFANFDDFVNLHPALSGLKKEHLLEGQTAPLHPGAERFYREAGLME